MFTRIPTFIPTESLETVNEQPRSKRETTKATYGNGQGRRRRAKTIRKRTSSKNIEDSHCEELPVIPGRESRAGEHKLQTPTHFHKLKKTKLFESRTTFPYTTHGQKERIITEINKKQGRTFDTMKGSRNSGMETELNNEEADIITHPTVHTRNRRKINDDFQNGHSNKHVKTWFHNQVSNNMDYYPSRTNERIHSRNESITDVESVRTPLPLDTQTSFRSLSTNHNDEVAKNFKSKIPIRFPDIQENKRYTESRTKDSPNKLNTTFPPIICANSSKTSSKSTGHVAQSIMDYQGMIEQDFKRLGENLENTFKLLQQYIKCNNTNSKTKHSDNNAI